MDYKAEMKDYVRSVQTYEASDLHLVTGLQPMFRVHRALRTFVQKPKLSAPDVEEFLKIVTSNADAVEYLKEKKNILFSFTFTEPSGEKINFRGAAYLQQRQIAIALRLVGKARKTLADLSLPAVLATVVEEPQGLFLVVGPAGHGKSTTLAAMIQSVNESTRKNILTIEDPIEFIFESKQSVIHQREVPGDVGSFREALDHALRADADVLMVGEMREIETMQTVVTAAEIGHLILSTVHANSASQTVTRIIDSFPAQQQNQIRNQLSQALLGVFSMRLLPRKSGGLIPAYEFMVNTPAISNLIRENRISGIDTAIQTGKHEGMVSLDQSLAELVKKGEISLEAARLQSTNERAFNKYL